MDPAASPGRISPSGGWLGPTSCVYPDPLTGKVDGAKLPAITVSVKRLNRPFVGEGIVSPAVLFGTKEVREYPTKRSNRLFMQQFSAVVPELTNLRVLLVEIAVRPKLRWTGSPALLDPGPCLCIAAFCSHGCRF